MDESLHAVFLDETLPLAAEVEQRLLRLERDAAAFEDGWRALLGVLHTIKGNCGMVGLDDAQGLAHAMEQRVRDVRRWPTDGQAQAIEALLSAADLLRRTVAAGEAGDDARGAGERLRALPATPPDAAEPPRIEPAADETPVAELLARARTVRVASDSLDRLLEATADLATWHQRARATVTARHPALEPLDGAARRLAELRDAILALRLVPLSTLLVRFERVVRDLGRATGKRAALAITGAEIGVDKHVIDELGEPLLHMIRNAIDHGLEAPRERVRAGKPEVGTIALEARARSGVLELIVRDDGRGIDPARLAAAAARAGIDATGWPAAQLLDLVFAPDLSTSEVVTELSGRGVGLDQARRALERIGGSVQVASTPGTGTVFHVRVPLVVAVQRSLIVTCGAARFGLPFTSVIEAFRLPAGELAGGEVSWRDARIPLLFLRRLLDLDGAEPEDAATCVVIDRPDAPLALVVDSLAGHQDLMVGELDPVFGRPRGVTGAAALADGSIVAVLDPLAVAS